MIPARIAAVIVLVAGWHSLWLLAGRAHGAGLATTVALGLAVAWGLVRAEHRLSAARLAAALAAMAAAAVTGLALLEIGATIGALLLCAVARPRWPMLALALLALPVLPTFDFLLAAPLRQLSALITVGLLRLNGVGVGLQGVTLEWHGRQLLFDGPCSGIRMLWAMLVLASLIGVVRCLPPLKFALLLMLATALAVVGNGLRAASLFYLESGFIPILSGPIAHELVGLAAFALVTGGTLAMLARGRRISA